MTEVVSLFGTVVPQERRPMETVIEALEKALEMAKAGEVQGIACTLLHADGLASYALCGVVGTYAMLGAATALRDALSDEVRG
jgi:hypothetical protein